MATATATRMGFCMKCQGERQISNPQEHTMKNGKPMTQGPCPDCGTKITVLGGLQLKGA